MTKATRVALFVFLLLGCAVAARADGVKDFIARPRIGAAVLTLPSHLTWRATADANGTYVVSLSLTMDVAGVIRNIKALSAGALDRAKPCGDLLRVLGADAKLTGPATLAYDLRFHYAKRLCAGGAPLEMIPADVSCKSNIVVSAAGSVLTADIQGATPRPCAIDGTAPGVFNLASGKIFKKHMIDLVQQLPPEFRGASITVNSVAFDVPPAPGKLRIEGQSTMTQTQYNSFAAAIASGAFAGHRCLGAKRKSCDG